MSIAPLLAAGGVLVGDQIGERYRRDWMGHAGFPDAVLRPKCTDDVADILREASTLRQTIVVQGGMTGLVQGALPQPGEISVSLELLNGIEDIDTDSDTMLVRAGTPLQTVQEAAEAHGLFFPVDVGSRGSAQIGGLIATNAGGNRVLRYGMMRQSVIGLEAVLPDGTVVSRLGGLIKDNTGLDLKQLFIGSEGTLGIITRARLQLQPAAPHRETALVAVPDLASARALLRRSRREFGPSLSSFEAMWPEFHQYVTGTLGIGRPPFENNDTILVLIEAMGYGGANIRSAIEQLLSGFLDDNQGCDAVLARSVAEANIFWRIRDSSGEAARAIAPFAGFDVSLHLSQMDAWVVEIRQALAAHDVSTIQIYGHLGDGNLHLVAGLGSDNPDRRAMIYRLVHQSVGSRGGSISAEHGIGLAKRDHLAFCRSPEEIAVMRKIKKALDPGCILNRGRIFDMGGAT